MDKAFVRVVDWGRNDGPWAVYVDAILGVASQTIHRIPVLSSPDSSDPVGGWKPLIRDAVAAACSDFGSPIDEVLFEDFTSLSVP